MGKITTLREIVEKLNSFPLEDTIYAEEPWSEEAKATVANDPLDGSLPEEAKLSGLKYFLEIQLARELVDDWLKTSDHQPDTAEVCKRVIHYATYDA